MTKRNSTSKIPSKQSKIKVGDVFTTNEGGTVTVSEYINYRKITIRHNDAYAHKASTDSSTLRLGQLKNPYKPSACNVGYLGVGAFKTWRDGKITNEYCIWRRMIERCYDPKYQDRSPTYIGCSVDNEWLNFQNFAEWLTNHDYYNLGYDLDKDLLTKGNKIYSPLHCSLIPSEINVAIITERDKSSGIPTGVRVNRKNMFVAHMSINGSYWHIGTFSCPIEAHNAYVLSKERYVRSKALEWRDRIAPNVFDALIKWTFNH